MKYYRYTFLFSKPHQHLYYRIKDKQVECFCNERWVLSAFVRLERELQEKAHRSADRLELLTEGKIFAKFMMEELTS